MLTYTVDFLSRSIIEDPAGIMRDIRVNHGPSGQPMCSIRLDRSTGSPDSSSESSFSTSNMILTLDKKATIVKNGAKTDKPAHSYIALISIAILSSKENKMILGNIYQFIMEKFPYYQKEDKAWRNSIRHNLSINECFIKNGRSDDGNGNFWSIHPACVKDFTKGDFRRRQARRRARKGVKDTNTSYLPVNGFQHNPVYTPMTSFPAGYHPITSTSLVYEPKTPSPVRYQQMASPTIGNFPSFTMIPGYQSTPSVSQNYNPYQRPVHSAGSYTQTRPNYTPSPSTSYPSPIHMSPVENLPITLPDLMTGNVDTYSNMTFNL